ncbi:MAG: site-specific integrase [Bacteroidales bacterium]|mgnify:CR=1 FL=1|nr:site-specific integrase [Bacteroidales bacterium]
MKVTLREKKLKTGKNSLYLDFWPPIINPETGKPTRREFLGIHVFDKPRDLPEKEYNKESLQLSKSICLERQLDLNSGRFGIQRRAGKNQDFIAYFEVQMNKRPDEGSNKDNWYSAWKIFARYTNNRCTFGMLTERFVSDYMNYLMKDAKCFNSLTRKISENTAYSYFNKFKACLNEAVHEGLLPDNPIHRIKSMKQPETYREFLTLEELQKLAKTPCEHDVLKRAALFSALTGMRFGDIYVLKWKQIQHSLNNGYFIRFTQRKTKGMEVLPITEEAYSLCGIKDDSESKVFSGLRYSATLNQVLLRWILSAGISKKVTFHCFRHTFATLQLSMGTDIYTVSKLLGHKDISTTQIYAKVIDRTKNDAVQRIHIGLDSENMS